MSTATSFLLLFCALLVGGALSETRGLSTWGSNDIYQLGVVDKLFQWGPEEVDLSLAPGNITHFGSHNYGHVMVTENNQLVTWGSNSENLLGYATSGNVLRPTPVPMTGALAGITVDKLWVLPLHCFIRTTTGQLISWGDNMYGQLGINNNTDAFPTNVVMSYSSDLFNITKLAGGWYHVLALSATNKLYSWGMGDTGQLGTGNTASQRSPVGVNQGGALSGKTIIDISCTGYNSYALDSNGLVYSWGWNFGNALASSASANRLLPDLIDYSGILSGKIGTAIYAGLDNAFVYTSTNELFAWATGSANADLTGAITKVNTTGMGTLNLMFCSRGCAAYDGSKYYVWGQNNAYQLGIGDFPTFTRFQPSVLPGAIPSGATIRGASTSVAWGSNNKLMSWGQSYQGWNRPSQPDPVRSDTGGVLQNDKPVSVQAGNAHAVVLTESGAVYTWGDCFAGDATSLIRPIPTQISTSGALSTKTIVQVAAGSRHAALLTSDGQVFTWGQDSVGGLGLGVSFAYVPTQVAGAISGVQITKIVAAPRYMLALSADGQVYGWGFQRFDLFGPDRPSTVEELPMLVADTYGFTDIAGSEDHIVAVNASGVFALGNNPSYQLGTGNTDPSTVPVPVAYDFSASGVTMVAAGRDHSLVSNGTVIWAWGGNGVGQLGDGTTQSRPTPVMINMTALYGKTISKIFATNTVSAALTSDGELWAWGNGNLIARNALNPTRVANTGYLSSNPLINDFAVGATFAVVIQTTRPDPPHAPPVSPPLAAPVSPPLAAPVSPPLAPPVSPPLDPPASPPQTPPVASSSAPLVPPSSSEATPVAGGSAPMSSPPSTVAPQGSNPMFTPVKASPSVPASSGHKLLGCDAIIVFFIIGALWII